MRAFSDHCAYLGFKLNNVRWSWGALSEDRKSALFTMWSDEVKGRLFVLSPIAVRRPGAEGEAADQKAGGREMSALAEYVANDPSVSSYGVLCVAIDPKAAPRVRKQFDKDTVFKLRVFRDGTSIVAEIIDRVPIEELLAKRTK